MIRPAGRMVAADQEPEKGFFYRSDHFEFAKQGVPLLYTEAGVQFVGKDSTYGMKKREEYTSRDYQQPSDETYGRTGSLAPSSRPSVTRC
ncbi:M28 family peptidase [Gemmatimonas sp.]|uniref:M28 family peptidase n=1 Tax=Gemmatimonas sp. TaxID=1962908 RepID=UPI00356439F1